MGCLVHLVVEILGLISRVVVDWAGRTTTPGRYSLGTQGRAWFLLIWLILAWPLSGLLSHLLVEGPSAAALGWLALVLVILFPWPLVRALTIPLGLLRTSYYLTFLASFTWWRDPSGGALLAAVLARRRHASVRERTEFWLRNRLAGLHVLRGAGALASAMASEIDGDLALACEKVRAVGDFDRRVLPRLAVRLAARSPMLEAERLRGDSGGRSASPESRILELADAADRLVERIDSRGTRNPLHELDEWCALRRLYGKAVARPGTASRSEILDVVLPALEKQAVWLFDKLQQRPLANAMFHWLLKEAEAASPDAEGLLENLRKNVAGGV